MRYFLLTTLILTSLGANAFTLSEQLSPFKAKYTAEYNGRSLNGSRQLSVRDGQWQLTSEFKTTFVSIRESSQGNINNGTELSVDRYDYKRKIFGIKKRQSRIFDNANNTVHFDDAKTTGTYSVPADAFDTASQQLYIREMLMRGETQFSMPMAGRNRLKQNHFKANKIAPITLPIGTINAIQVDKIEGKKSSRKTTMWFSPDYDYQLVKLSQIEKNGKYYEMLVTEIE